MLLAAKTRLLSHLRKEDTELYPVLNKAALADPALKLTLDFYAGAMQEISSNALLFFDKYAAGSLGTEFARDFGAFFTTISRRIRDEEQTIYAEYEKRQSR